MLMKIQYYFKTKKVFYIHMSTYLLNRILYFLKSTLAFLLDCFLCENNARPKVKNIKFLMVVIEAENRILLAT